MTPDCTRMIATGNIVGGLGGHIIKLKLNRETEIAF